MENLWNTNYSINYEILSPKPFWQSQKGFAFYVKIQKYILNLLNQKKKKTDSVDICYLEKILINFSLESLQSFRISTTYDTPINL